MKKALVVIMLFGLLFSGCLDSDKKEPADETKERADIRGTNEKAIIEPAASEESVVASNKLVRDAAGAFCSGDREALMPLLSESMKESLREADLSAPEVSQLGKALEGAVLSEKYPEVMVYEFDYGGKKQYFYTIKEGDLWKIDGL